MGSTNDGLLGLIAIWGCTLTVRVMLLCVKKYLIFKEYGDKLWKVVFSMLFVKGIFEAIFILMTDVRNYLGINILGASIKHNSCCCSDYLYNNWCINQD